MSPPLLPDSRGAQIERVALFLERNPGATLTQIERACDTGSVTKVISVMQRPEVGFVLRREWRLIQCNKGRNTRKVAHYWIVARPRFTQGDLFNNS